MSSVPKNQQISPHALQSFHFEKITGTLIFFWLQMPSFNIKEKSQQNLKFFKYFILGPQNGQRKNNLVSFLALKNQRRHSPLTEAPKTLLKKFVHFRVTVNIF